jgi:hypothetical protein
MEWEISPSAEEEWGLEFMILTFTFMNRQKMRVYVCMDGAANARDMHQASQDFLEEHWGFGRDADVFGNAPEA